MAEFAAAWIVMLVALIFPVVMIACTGVDLSNATDADPSGAGKLAYGLLIATYVLLLICMVVLTAVLNNIDAGFKSWPGLFLVLGLVALAFVQKMVYFGCSWELYFQNEPGDFGNLLVQDVDGNGVTTSLVGRPPDLLVMDFDNQEVLQPGQNKGFSVGMYLGLDYGSTAPGSAYKWNAKNDVIKVPLFVRGQTAKTNLQDFGMEVVDKSPLIWLVMSPNGTMSTSDDVKTPFSPSFLIEFNHSQPTGTSAAAGSIQDMGTNACHVIDDITAACQFYRDSSMFDAVGDDLNIDASSINDKYLTYVAFVFEEMFTSDTLNPANLAQNYVTKISVYVGAKLKQTLTFPGTIRVSDNRVSVLPTPLFSDTANPSGTDTPDNTQFLANSRMANVTYYSYPLGAAQIKSNAAKKIGPTLTTGQAVALKGNMSTVVAPANRT